MLEAGLSPAYVMDEMPVYEIRIALEGIELKNRTGWEQTRFIAYVIAQVNSRKKLRLKDIMTFEWDREKNEHQKMDESDIERLKKQQEEIIKNYKNGGKSES